MNMTKNKKTIQEYMDGFRAGDHAKVLACLTDDVEWYMPGFFNLTGKEAFDKEIENENFTGLPAIQVSRMIEEDNIVIAEGAVQAQMKNGGKLDAVFSDVFEMENGKIRKLTTYLMKK